MARGAKHVPPNDTLVVEIPILPSDLKRKYVPLEDVSTNAKLCPLEELLGEHRKGRDLFYFARLGNGIISMVPEQLLKDEQPQLIESYLERKASKTLKAFDPSASNVNYPSRIRNTIKIDLRRLSSSTIASLASGSRPADSDYSGSEDGPIEAPSDDDDYDNDTDEKPVRRRLRSSRPKGKDLPFSPRKLRSRAIALREEEEESGDDESIVVVSRPTRKSTRTRKKQETAQYVEDSEISEDYSEYSAAPRTAKPKAPKIKRGKASRPAYGHFRGVEDLDYDPCSDEESAPLRYHRRICEKCERQPAHELLNALSRRKSRGRPKKRPEDEEDDFEDEEEKYENLGGWVQCLTCPVSAHWRCLSGLQRDEILKAAKDRDIEELRSKLPPEEALDADGNPKPLRDEVSKRDGLGAYQITEFKCGSCMKGGICLGCMDVALEPDASVSNRPSQLPGLDQAKNDEMAEDSPPHPPISTLTTQPPQLFFRCLLCKRLAHYEHLPKLPDVDVDDSLANTALEYQKDWKCADCRSYEYKVEHILAWRPYPPNAVEKPQPDLNHKLPLPREYLVKWVERSYRRVEWVPHMWLVATHAAKLKNFLADGTKVELLEQPVETSQTEDSPEVEKIEPLKPATSRNGTPFAGKVAPLVDAEKYISPLWKTVDRVLDVVLWSPEHQRKSGHRGTQKAKRRFVQTDEEEEYEDSKGAFDEVFTHGRSPPDKDSETVEEWEYRTGKTFSQNDIDRVVYGFFKWADLGYDDASWDSPPRRDDPTFPAFESAIERFIKSRSVFVPKGSHSLFDRKINSERDGYLEHHRKEVLTLDLGQEENLKLMDFQRDGFNWLCNNWWNLQHCILADEMGLGKTVQIVTFLGYIVQRYKVWPALVVVPQSTITNWVREFERWAPQLRVVPYYGESRSREVIKKYELYHKEVDRSKYTDAKFHVLITTYESAINPKDYGVVFKKQPRWEVLVIDEGQRLKNDSSLLFKKLSDLNAIHRVIMTGTPLNNNIRELFNLMNFLDPAAWNDLDALEHEYAELDDDLVKQLHQRLRPYFLRRIKSEVLKLPPKNEVIVPVSMAPLQKEIYKSLLERNLDALKGLTSSDSKSSHPVKKGSLNNLLMQLRKCLQHPYLIASDIEPQNLSVTETHDKLIDASAKFRLLKQLLPKLQARGHRILLFSQFVIALDIIEDFLVGEGYKCLRLDGSTKSRDRQKSMDEFNKPGSDTFLFLLSTRAGGVGINLYSADTVIIFDPDFNPHQDLQAIARAHRFGQQKTVMVFKLMVKDSAEDRIMQLGKRKLALEHLIVKKMEDDDSMGEDIQSILTFGAKLLFDDDGVSRDIIYSDADLDKLITKTEEEGEQPVPEQKAAGGLTFEFAKIWSVQKDSLEDVQDVEQDDAWAQTLEKIAAQRAVAQDIDVQTGRGARRKAAQTKPGAYAENLTPSKPGKLPRVSDESDGDYGDQGSPAPSSSSSSEGEPDELVDGQTRRKKKRRGSSLIHHDVALAPMEIDDLTCSLCGSVHGPSDQCPMAASSAQLAQYRLELITSTDMDDLDLRREAIQALEDTLYERGHMHFIQGQPLFLVEPTSTIPHQPVAGSSKHAW